MIALFFSLVLAAGSTDAERLAAGEVLVSRKPVEGSEMPESTARAVIDAPPPVVFAAINDCNKYTKTMPGIIEAKQLSQRPATPADGPHSVDVRVCRVVADLPFPFDDLTSVTQATHSIEEGKRWMRQWKLIEGTYRENRGKWVIEPYGADARKSLVTYVIHADPMVPLPAGFISGISAGKLPEMMNNVRHAVAAVMARPTSSPAPSTAPPAAN